MPSEHFYRARSRVRRRSRDWKIMPDITADAKRFVEDFGRIRAEIAKTIVGQEEIVEGVLTALFAGGHVLLEGLPGLGKTRLVRTLADALDLDFERIKCTPDIMPADI